MAVLVHMHSRFDPLKRKVYRLDRPTTVRRLVQRHRGLRPHTRVYRPGGFYGRRKVREFTQPTVCLLNGRALTRSEWKRTTVGADDIVAFYAPPTGGNTFKIIATIVLAVAIAVAAPYLGALIAPVLVTAGVGAATALAIGTAVAGIALSVVGYGLMSLFAEPPPPSVGNGFGGSTPASSPTYNLTAQGNYARLESAIPEAFGRNRMFPDFVTTPYATYDVPDPPPGITSTPDQWLHHIVGLGIGEFEIETDTLKLGDTPITSYPDIEWAVIPPGTLGDITIADERWITSPDLADYELLDAAVGSPWAGPYNANPAQTTVGTIGIDVAAPRGLWHFNPVSGGLDGRGVVFEVEAHLIDDNDDPIGDPDVWETFPPFGFLRVSQDPQRVTIQITLPSVGRWQVRVRRTDTKDNDLQSGHQLDWIGLRGRIVGRRRFTNMTCIQLKMKAGSALNVAQSRQFNVVATRKLETWDGSQMGTARAATRSPCDAFAYIGRTQNGGRLRDDQIALAELYASKADFEASGWTFDFIFDSATTVSEAEARVARAVVAERVTQGNQLHMVRDVPVVAPIAMFSQRNISPGSLSMSYGMVDSTSPDALIGTFVDQGTWKPRDVTVAFPDSAQERPSRMTLYGVGIRDQARAVLWNLARGNRYRRKVFSFSTPMEGLAVTFGDGISFSHDLPNYGQTLEVIDFDGSDPAHPIFTFADRPRLGGTATLYAAVRDSLARKAGPFVATAVAGQPLQLMLDVPTPGPALPPILIGGDRERTWLQLGPGERYARKLKVKQVQPRDEFSADLIAFDDDPRMYAPLPVEPEVPIGAPTDPLVIPIGTEDGPIVNLRTLAGENDYSGLPVQIVTFTQAADVDVTIIRGSWPLGAVPILQLAGICSGLSGLPGPGGAGGAPVPAFSDPGNGLPGTAGGAGGTALDASTGPLILQGAGTIRAGAGGGGGGGGGGGSYYETESNGQYTGHQVIGGNGGNGNGGAGTPGTNDGTVTSGDGGNGGASGGYGVAGTAGAPGTAASGGLWFGTGGAGGAGGPAGRAIVGNANVNRTGFTGTIVGPVV